MQTQFRELSPELPATGDAARLVEWLDPPDDFNFRHFRMRHMLAELLVDTFDCTVQRAYGGLASAVYLIDSEGRVAFCGAWGQSSALTRAIDEPLVVRVDPLPARMKLGLVVGVAAWAAAAFSLIQEPRSAPCKQTRGNPHP